MKDFKKTVFLLLTANLIIGSTITSSAGWVHFRCVPSEYDGKTDCYRYVTDDNRVLANTTTPDGRIVDENGLLVGSPDGLSYIESDEWSAKRKQDRKKNSTTTLTFPNGDTCVYSITPNFSGFYTFKYRKTGGHPLEVCIRDRMSGFRGLSELMLQHLTPDNLQQLLASEFDIIEYDENKIAHYTNHEKYDQLAKEIRNKVGITEDMSDRDKIRKAHEYICDHHVYGNESESIRGEHISKYVCEYYANDFYDIMVSSGVKTEIIKGTANGGRHAWNRVWIDGSWSYIDVTWNDCYRDNGDHSDPWYLISYDDMDYDHSEENETDDDF